MIRRPPRSTQSRSSAASDVYKRQVEVVDGTGLLEILWYGLERVVETEGHVPCLPREDHEYCSKFQSSVAAGKDGYQCQHDAWHEPQDGDDLQDVQHLSLIHISEPTR